MALGYYWLLCLVDRTSLMPLFGYQGLAYRSVSVQTQIYVLGLILLCTAITPVRYRQPSDGVLYMLLSLIVIPVLMVAVTDVVFTNVATSVIISVAGAYLLLAVCSKVPRLRSDSVGRLEWKLPWTIAVLPSIASYGLGFATFGIQFKLLSFSDVYNVRSVFTEQESGPLGYLLDWQATVINPFFIVYGIRFCRIPPLAAGALGDFLIYTTTGDKSVLFSVIAIIAIIVALHQNESAARPSASSVRIDLFFAVLAAVAYIIGRLNHSFIWTSLFVRHLNLVAGVNTGYYGNPNVNIWADAYANFGYIGVITFTLILAGFLWLYDGVAQKIDRQEATVLIALPALTLTNSALFTCLFTYGMLIARFFVIQRPGTVQQADEATRWQACHGRSGSVELTVR